MQGKMIGIHAILSTDTAVVPLAVDVDDDEDVDVDADVVAGVDVVVERTNSQKGCFVSEYLGELKRKTMKGLRW